MQYIFPEPSEYGFTNVNGHDGKFFDSQSPRTSHLIIECHDKLTVSLIQNESEFNYYIIKGHGYFIVNGQKQDVKVGDLIVLPPGTTYTFGGELKMLLIDTPRWSAAQETIIREPISEEL